MKHRDLPSSVMYAELKSMGIDNRSAAYMMIDTDKTYSDVNMRARIESRDQLSRFIVHVAPGSIPPELFKDFAQSAQALLFEAMHKERSDKANETAESILERLTGPAAEKMMSALTACGVDASAYRNAHAAIANKNNMGSQTRALMNFALFVATGCTGDPLKGAKAAEECSAHLLGEGFLTPRNTVVEKPEPLTEAPIEALSLVRIVNGRMKAASSFYELAANERGTEIGTLAEGESYIRDVDADVSRRHARVFMDQDGRWFVEDLGSTNGTSVIEGSSKEVRVVAPPRAEREQGWESPRCEIFPTDTICLGATTRFMVIPMAQSDEPLNGTRNQVR